MKNGVNDAAAIVYVWPYVEWGGAQRYLIALMHRAVRSSRVVVALPAHSDPALVAELRAIGAECAFMRIRLPAEAPTSLAGRVRQHLRKWQAEWQVWTTCRRLAEAGTVFHCDLSPMMFTWPLAWLAASHGVVVTLHTAFPRVAPLRARAWRARFSVLSRRPGLQIVAANRHVRDSLRPYLPAAAVDAIPIAYSPVDRAEIADGLAHGPSRSEARALVGVSEDHVLVVTGAQFIDRKGCWVLVDAARLVRQAAPDVDFVWVGPAVLSPDVAQRLAASASGLRYVPQTALGPGRRPYLGVVAAADIFALPSLEEGLPLALIEAMALGVAVVSTPVNAIPEAVSDGDDGLLVPPNDAPRLAEAILRLRADAHLRRTLAASGQRRTEAFSADETARVTFEVYRAVGDRVRPPNSPLRRR